MHSTKDKMIETYCIVCCDLVRAVEQTLCLMCYERFQESEMTYAIWLITRKRITEEMTINVKRDHKARHITVGGIMRLYLPKMK